MTLEELGRQYAEELKTAQKQLRRAKRDLRKARTVTEIADLNRKIYIYEEMCADLKSMSEHLIHYYEER